MTSAPQPADSGETTIAKDLSEWFAQQGVVVDAAVGEKLVRLINKHTAAAVQAAQVELHTEVLRVLNEYFDLFGIGLPLPLKQDIDVLLDGERQRGGEHD